jgi:hypothetical protein
LVAAQLVGINRFYERDGMVEGTESLQTLYTLRDWLQEGLKARGERTIVKTASGTERWDQ